MKFFRIFWRNKVTFLIFLGALFLLGYFVAEYFYNSFQAKYIYSFAATKENASEIISKEFYDEVFDKIEENNRLAAIDSSYKRISYAKIDYASMLCTAQLTKKNNIFYLEIQKKYFPNIISTSTGRVNESANRIKNYFTLILSYTDYDTSFVGVELVNNINPWLIGGISLGVGGFFMLFGLWLYSLKKENETEVIEDNQLIFTSIFHKKYWKDTIGFLKSVKKMCTLSLLFGFMLLCKLLPIPSGFGSLGISFTYLFFSVIGWIYGPICGIFIGFCSDILGYFINPGGVFFLGYTLDAMLAGFVYGICFYKKRITFGNCLLARGIVNLFINVGLGSLWWKVLYHLNWESFIAYVSLTSLPKNVLYLLPQSILLYLLFKAIAKILVSFGMIDERIGKHIQLF